jgi:hypothetical protein
VVCSIYLSAKVAACRGKIQVEIQLFMASVAVIFGVDFTGPHILVVKLTITIVFLRKSNI